jgi:hypothetical protein
MCSCLTRLAFFLGHNWSNLKSRILWFLKCQIPRLYINFSRTLFHWISYFFSPRVEEMLKPPVRNSPLKLSRTIGTNAKLECYCTPRAQDSVVVHSWSSREPRIQSPPDGLELNPLKAMGTSWQPDSRRSVGNATVSSRWHEYLMLVYLNSWHISESGGHMSKYWPFLMLHGYSKMHVTLSSQRKYVCTVDKCGNPTLICRRQPYSAWK